MGKIYFAAVAAAAAILILTLEYRRETPGFYGIADAREIVVNWETPVEIRRLPVVQGQAVRAGDTLAELARPDLDMKISQIGHVLNEMKARKVQHVTFSQAEIRQLKAQQAERANAIRAEIQELEAQYALNRKLLSELRSIGPAGEGGEGEAQNPLRIRIEGLKRELELAMDPSQVRIDRLLAEISAPGAPLAEQVHKLEDELSSLLAEKRSLFITAQADGLVGSVNFKEGERAAPFAPIVTLHAKSPSYVRGYIHEEVYSRVFQGQRVEVASIGSGRRSVPGDVATVGARIVEYPVRLRKRPDIQIWGREVMIRIPSENGFLLGEKVLISLPRAAGIAVPKPAPAKLDEGTVELPGIEASGLLYLADLDKYLVVGDDTEGKRPTLLLLDSAARPEKTLVVEGLAKIDDMESIAADEAGRVYIAASQSRNRKGKTPAIRKLLIKAVRQGESLRLEGQAPLLDLLERAAQDHPGEAWAAFLARGIREGGIDIEGLAVRDGKLYLGFKSPLEEGKAVILEVTSPEGLFQGRVPGPGGIALWRKLALGDGASGTPGGISDMAFHGEDLYLLSAAFAAGGGESGGLWVLRKAEGAPERIRDFPGLKPEGLAFGPGRCRIAFDNGRERPSRILSANLGP